MTDPAIEPVDETSDELWADDELSDEALDRRAAPRGKACTTAGGGGGLCLPSQAYRGGGS